MIYFIFAFCFNNQLCQKNKHMKKKLQFTFLAIACIISITVSAQSGWQPQNNPAGNDTLLGQIQFINNNEGWIATGNGGYLKTTNGGASWTKHYPFPNDSLVHSSDPATGMSWVSATHGWMIFATGSWMEDSKGVVIVSTTDGGQNWTKKTIDTTGYFPLQIQFVNQTTGWATMFKMNVGMRFMRTTDGGANWSELQSNAVTTFHFADALNGWAVTTRREDSLPSTPTKWSIEKSADGGVTWTSTYTDPAVNVQTLNFLNAINASTCWVKGPGMKMLKTTNGGANWSTIPLPIKYGTDSRHKFFHFIDANTGWITEDPEQNEEYCVVHHTTNGGTTWEVQNSLVKDGSVFSVYFNDASHGWLVGEQCINCQDSNSRTFVGVIRATNNGGTGVREYAEDASLMIYPNPAIGLVQVKTAAIADRMECYTILGEQVISVIPASTHEILNLSALSKGVYFIKVYAAERVTTRKLILE